MKRIKIILSLLVIVGTTNVININAEEKDNIKEDGITEYIKSYSENEIQAEPDIIIQEKVNTVSRRTIARRKEKVGTTITGFIGEKEAYGQPRDGVVFTSSNAGFYWKDSNRVVSYPTFNVSFGGTLFNVNIGLKPGEIGTGGIGVFQGITPDQVNKHVKLYVSRQYEVVQYKVYEYDTYAGPVSERFIGYEYSSVPVSYRLKIKVVS